MMHRFSIIVPLLGSPRLFDETLAAVLRNRPPESQVIVVHDGRYDDPYQLGGDVDFVESNEPGLIPFFNRARDVVSGDLTALIRPGVELGENWHLPVASEFEEEEVGSVTPILVTPRSPNTMVAAGVKPGWSFRRLTVGSQAKIAARTIRRVDSIGPTSWAAFYRTAALRQIGICGQQLDETYLDVDIALGLKLLGYQNVLCPDCVISIERASLVERELTLPHGRSAQRAVRRSGNQPAVVQTVMQMTAEVLSAPLQPWKFRHAWQRLGARRFAELDFDYADRLEELASARRELSADFDIDYDRRPRRAVRHTRRAA